MSHTEGQSKAEDRRAALVVTKLPSGNSAIVAQDFDQVWRLASIFAASGEMVPKTYRDNPEGAAMAIMWGMELGISPIQAIQGIAVIGGKPSVWGDLLLALCQASPKFVDLIEVELRAENGAYIGARATAKREGREDVVREFTLQMAHDAQLTAKSNTPWQQKGYQPRMCQMRARSWALRDQFADALRGVASADEMRDVIEGEATVVERTPKRADDPAPVRTVTMPTAQAAEALPPPEKDELAQLDALLLRQREKIPAGGLPADAVENGSQAGGVGGISLNEPITKITEGQRAVFDALLEAKGLSENDFVNEFGDFVHEQNYLTATKWLQDRRP